SASNALFPRRNGSNPPLSRPSGTLCLSDGERLGEKFPRKISRIEPLKRSSRREEALIDFGFRISDFGFGVISLLTSAATTFGVRGLCSLSASLIWLPTRKTGFNDAPGS